MFNVKWGIMSGLLAFVLAFLMSLLIGHASLLIALVRALIFAALFFLLGIGAWVLINSYIPELLTANSNDATKDIFSGDKPGSRINITLDGQSDAALPGKDSEPHEITDVEDINDLVSGNFTPPPRETAQRIDQTPANGYNDESGGFSSEPENFAAAGGGEDGDFFMNFSGFVPGATETGESHSSSDSLAFSGDSDTASFDESSLPERKVSRNRPEKFEGDFNAKEIASGIRTVLEKDKKG